MTTKHLSRLGMSLALLFGPIARAETKITVAHNPPGEATAAFTFKDVAPPVRTDAAGKAVFSISDGTRDPNGGGLEALHDGRLPTEADQPASNFFFSSGSNGGRLTADLGRVIDIKQVNTYTWHPGDRAPQVYTLYASDGADKSFDRAPKRGIDPDAVGWKKLAVVDTRPKEGDVGGQFAVSIADTQGTLGKYRYLLFDIFRTESRDPFGNTFFSEINIIDSETRVEPATLPAGLRTIKADDGKYQITLDTTETPDLTEWAEKELAPVVEKWYPLIAAMLPSDGYEAPRRFTIAFHKDMEGVANTAGTRVNCAAKWFRGNLKGEARGAVVHELVHVVQQYGRSRAKNPRFRPPGWLVEGIPDYIRWYQYEPQSHGAEMNARSLARARFDGSYRVSANFLNYVTTRYDKNLIARLNAALREGTYEPDLWKKWTGKNLDELNEEWKSSSVGQG